MWKETNGKTKLIIKIQTVCCCEPQDAMKIRVQSGFANFVWFAKATAAAAANQTRQIARKQMYWSTISGSKFRHLNCNYFNIIFFQLLHALVSYSTRACIVRCNKRHRTLFTFTQSAQFGMHGAYCKGCRYSSVGSSVWMCTCAHTLPEFRFAQHTRSHSTTVSPRLKPTGNIILMGFLLRAI